MFLKSYRSNKVVQCQWRDLRNYCYSLLSLIISI